MAIRGDYDLHLMLEMFWDIMGVKCKYTHCISFTVTVWFCGYSNKSLSSGAKKGICTCTFFKLLCGLKEVFSIKENINNSYVFSQTPELSVIYLWILIYFYFPLLFCWNAGFAVLPVLLLVTDPSQHLSVLISLSCVLFGFGIYLVCSTCVFLCFTFSISGLK